MNDTRAPIKIFVSSPSDVHPERGACLRVIARLNQRYKDLVTLEGVFWEEQFFPAHTDFQTWINKQTPPWACHLVVCILWSRIGSPLSDAWPRRPDGTRYESGTVAEFEMSRDLAIRDATPDLYMFLKRASLPGADTADALARTAEAKRVVEQFVHRWFHQPNPVEQPGSGPVHPFTAGLNPFTSADEFEEQFAAFLDWWLREKGWIDRRRTWDLSTQGLPYVGLAPFDMAHAPVFFGRGAERRNARRLLIEADAAGLPYLLISGGSGVGKSSLARAGLVADLCIDTPQEVWTHAIVLADADPIPALASALLAPGGALARSFADAHFGTPERLAAALAAPGIAATVFTGVLDAVASALAAERRWSAPPVSRLLLVIDQVEALADASASSQRALVALVTALAATRRVWVVATVRSDRQSALLTQAPPPPMAPLLTGLLQENRPAGAELKLSPPDEAALRDIIEAPAREAGLSFEDGEPAGSLADALCRAMAGHTDALPLMQELLRNMFATTREASWADYERLGRLEGAIAAAAKAAIDGLPPPVQAELGPLLLVLTGAVGADGSAVSRPARRSEFETSATRTALVSALLEARLLVVYGEGRVRVSHDALLRTWPRAQKLLAAAGDYIRLRERLRPHWEEWRSNKALLPPSPLLSEAAQSLPALEVEEDTAPLAKFVRASRDADKQARRRRTMVWSLVTVCLAIAVVKNDNSAQKAETQRVLAVEEKDRADKNAVDAEQQKNAATTAATRSERNFIAALNAVTTLVSDIAQGLRDRGLPTHTVGQILAMSDQALDELERVAPDDDRVRRLRLLALGETARTFLRAGALPEALDAGQKLLAFAQTLVNAAPEDSERKRDLAVGYSQLGDVWQAQNDVTRALAAYGAAKGIFAELAASDPGNPERLLDASIGASKIGDVLMGQRELIGAFGAYNESLKFAEQLSDSDPANPDWQRRRARAHRHMGDVLLELEGPALAHVQFQLSAKLTVHLAQAYPEQKDLQRDLSMLFRAFGRLATREERFDQALDFSRKGLEATKRLTLADPGDGVLQNDLANAHADVGDLLLLQPTRNLPAAISEFQESLKAAELGATAAPSNALWQRMLFVSLERLATSLAEAGPNEDACAMAKRLAEQAEIIADRFPNHRERDQFARIAAGRLDGACRPIVLPKPLNRADSRGNPRALGPGRR